MPMTLRSDAFSDGRAIPRRYTEDGVDLSPALSGLQRELVEGWAQAALELVPAGAPMIEDWLQRRLAHLASGRSHITVSHHDLAAWPATDFR